MSDAPTSMAVDRTVERIKAGKTTMHVSFEGCYNCGVMRSTGFQQSAIGRLEIGGKTTVVLGWICDVCWEPELF